MAEHLFYCDQFVKKYPKLTTVEDKYKYYKLDRIWIQAILREDNYHKQPLQPALRDLSRAYRIARYDLKQFDKSLGYKNL